MAEAKVRRKRKDACASELDYKMCFSNEHGKKVLEDILGFCGFQTDVFNQNPYQSSFNQGKQCVANEINKMLTSKMNED